MRLRGRVARMLAVGLAFLVLVVHGNTIRNGFVFDDTPFVEENWIIRDLANVPEMFTSAFWESTSASQEVLYRPLVTLSYALNFAADGLNPFGYHLVNVLLHLANALLVFGIVYSVSGRGLLSGAVATLFGVHPINTEAVAWVAARGELLAALFALGALLLYVMAFPPVGERDEVLRRYRWLQAGSLAAFLLALLSKEGAVALVGVLVIYDLAWRSPAGRWRRIGPYVVLTALYVGALVAAFGGVGAPSIDFVFNPLVEETAYVRALTGVKVLGMALQQLAWPARLAADYSFEAIPVARTMWHPAVLGALGAALVLSVVWILSWRHYRVLFLGLGLLVCYTGLLFVNALHPAASLFAERFLYVPSIGFAVVCVAVADRALGHIGRRREVIAALALIVVVLPYSIEARSRNFEWRDNYTLFASAAQVNSRSAFVQASLASEYFQRADYGLARAHSLRALEIYPEYSRAHVNLGDVALAQGTPAEALRHLTRAVELSPRSFMAHLSLGVAYRRLGDLTAAERHYTTALELNPKSPAALNNLANLELLRGDRTKAFDLWGRALAVDPLNPEALFNLALEHDKAGQLERAEDYYERFLAVAPDRMQRQKAAARARLGR